MHSLLRGQAEIPKTLLCPDRLLAWRWAGRHHQLPYASPFPRHVLHVAAL